MVKDLKCDILTEELESLVLEINKWLVFMYDSARKINQQNLSGNTLTEHLSYIETLETSMDVINKVLDLGYYNMIEKEILNELRKQWIAYNRNT